jgi:hypothetical protein
MKKNSLKDNHFILELIIFSFSLFYLLFTQGLASKFFYAVIIFLVSKSLLLYLRERSFNWKKIKIFLVLSVGFYAVFSSQISELELWGDEIGVIQIADLPFHQIAYSVLSDHASVPPFDYWTLSVLKPILFLFGNNFHEILYRLPYMFYHSISAIIFTFLVSSELSKNKKNIRKKQTLSFTSLVIFLTYFFDPYLFFYSLEVRYFALSILGSLLILKTVLNDFYFEKNTIFFSLLLGLNSIFQFILVGAYLILAFFKTLLDITWNKKLSFQKILLNKKWQELFIKKNFLIVLLTHLVLGIILITQVHFPDSVSIPQAFDNISSAFWQFFDFNIPLSRQKLSFMFLLSLSLLVPIFKKRKTKNIHVFLLGIISLFAISFIGYFKGYFDFSARHYMFTLPFWLFLVFSNLQTKKVLLRSTSLALIIFCFTIPWSLKVRQILRDQTYISKSFLDSKKIILESKKNKKGIIIIPGNEGIDPSYYGFIVNSFFWYARQYGVPFIFTESSNEGCEVFESKNNAVLLAVEGKPDCIKTSYRSKNWTNITTEIITYEK